MRFLSETPKVIAYFASSNRKSDGRNVPNSDANRDALQHTVSARARQNPADQWVVEESDSEIGVISCS